MHHAMQAVGFLLAGTTQLSLHLYEAASIVYLHTHCAHTCLHVCLQEMNGKEVDGRFLGVKLDSYA